MQEMTEQMEKDLIFSQRKEIKKKSHQIVRHHYFLLTFLIILAAFFGTEFKMAKDGLSKNGFSVIIRGSDESENGIDTEIPGSIFDDEATIGKDSVLSEVMSGNLERGDEIASELDAQIDRKSVV